MITIVGAVAIVLLVKAYVVNPYRIPSSSMEPTLHCAKPASGCEARFSDRVLANRFIYHLRDPRRGEIVVFDTPDAARVKCGAGGTFVKRLIGLPGETVEVRLQRGLGYVFINGKQLREPYIQATRRSTEEFGPVKVPQGRLLHDGGQPLAVVRLARVGLGAARQPDRQGLRDLLAAEPAEPSLAREAEFRRAEFRRLIPALRAGQIPEGGRFAAATARGVVSTRRERYPRRSTRECGLERRPNACGDRGIRYHRPPAFGRLPHEHDHREP